MLQRLTAVQATSEQIEQKVICCILLLYVVDFFGPDRVSCWRIVLRSIHNESLNVTVQMGCWSKR